jgi:hypothetical protein
MYFLTSIANLGRKNRPSHCFGYYLSKTKVIDAALTNRGNMIEAFYDHLLIEKIGEGIHAQSIEIQWFKYNTRKNGWIICDKPRWSKGILNWAIG